jgi:hypothetical protein
MILLCCVLATGSRMQGISRSIQLIAQSIEHHAYGRSWLTIPSCLAELIPQSQSSTSLLKPPSLANIRIHIEPPLRIQRNPLPHLLDPTLRQLHHHSALLFIQLPQHLRIRINNHTMPPRIIIRLHIPTRTAQPHENLIVHRPRTRLQFPVQRAGGHVERAGVEQEKRAFAGGDGGELGEADVVADSDGDLSVLGEVYEGDFVARGEHVALAELNLAGDVDVEEVHFAVGSQELAARREGQVGVVPLLSVFAVCGLGAGVVDDLWDAAADDVRVCLFCEARQRVEGWGLGLGWWRREERLGVLREVLCAVGAVEALGEDDDVCAAGGGLEDFGARVREVVRFVGGAGELDEGELDGLL